MNWVRSDVNYSKLDSFHTETPTNAGTSTDQQSPLNQGAAAQSSGARASSKQGIERRMLMRHKSHIKHTFRDFDEKGQNLCKFVCTTYWATQFHAVREAFLSQSIGSKDISGDAAVSTLEQASLEHKMIVLSSSASQGQNCRCSLIVLLRTLSICQRPFFMVCKCIEIDGSHALTKLISDETHSFLILCPQTNGTVQDCWCLSNWLSQPRYWQAKHGTSRCNAGKSR